MEPQILNEETKKAVKAKFGRKKKIVSKTELKYPYSAEREFIRFQKKFAGNLKKSMQKYLPEIMKLYKEGRYDSRNYDDKIDRENQIKAMILAAIADAQGNISDADVRSILERVSKQTKGASINEWNNALKQTLGIEIPKSYAETDIYNVSIEKWVSDNTSKINEMMRNAYTEMEETIIDDFRNERSVTDAKKDLNKTFNSWKGYLTYVAIDQISNLFSNINRQQMELFGVNEYVWTTVHDSRVRDSHASFDGHIYSFNNPPAGWYMTNNGIVYTGRSLNPGEDYGCRCTPRPVINIEELRIPFM